MLYQFFYNDSKTNLPARMTTLGYKNKELSYIITNEYLCRDMPSVSKTNKYSEILKCMNTY